MGFRDPITTAEAVDTGTGVANPGVRVYEKTTPVPQGVVEWRTGAMDPGGNATAALSGGGSGGSAFAIRGGATELVTAPEIDLNVESLAAGGYGPVARLVTHSGQAFTDAPLIGPDTKWTALPLAAAFAAFDTNNVPRYGRLSNGEIALEGIAKIASGTVAAGASAVIGSLPAALAPAVNVFRPVVILTSAGAWFAAAYLVISANQTNVAVYNTTTGAFGAGAAWTLGCTYAPATTLST